MTPCWSLQMPYEKSFEIRWSEIDVNWHMRNTAYGELGTTTRFAYLSENGFTYERFQSLGFGPVILREETKYMREVLLGMSVTVTFKLSGISKEGSHFELHHDVLLEDGTTAAIMRVEGSWMDLSTRKLRPAPTPLLEALERLDRTDDFRELKALARGRNH